MGCNTQSLTQATASPYTYTATCTVSGGYANFLENPTGHPIVATYSGITNEDFPSTSSTYDEPVQNPTTTTMQPATPNPANTNTSVKYTADIVDSNSNDSPQIQLDGGSATFYDNGNPISCSSSSFTVGSVGTPTVATCTVSSGYATVGSHPITATYSGDTDFTTSTSVTPLTEVISNGGGLTPVLTLVASPNPPTQVYSSSDAVILSGTGLPANATGTVTFTTANDAFLCTGTVYSGAARCTTSSSQLPGTYQVLATYSGDQTYESATAITSYVITPLSSETMVAQANPPVSIVGTPVDLTATNLPTPATGTVTFTSGGSELCTGPVSSGTATCTTSNLLPADTYPVIATYSGDSHYGPATAPTSFVLETSRPIAKPKIGTTPRGTPITLTPPAPTGDGPFTCAMVSEPPAKDGHYTMSSNCKLTFDPAPDFIGDVHFTYTVRDAHGVVSTPAPIVIHVTPVRNRCGLWRDDSRNPHR
jgi:hypothetical protein